jgi:hypothetical protein
MDCALDCGDCVSVKSGYNEDGRRVGMPAEDIVVANCNMLAGSGSGLAIGSETAGGIRNVSMVNCVVTKSRHGVYIRSPRGRGGGVERVRVENVVFDELIERAIRISCFYDSIRGEGIWAKPEGPKWVNQKTYYPTTQGNPETDRSLSPPIDEGTPLLRDFDFSDLSVGAADGVAYLEGLPERFITGVRLHNVIAPRTRTGLFCARVDELAIDHLVVGKLEGPAVDAHQVQRLDIHRLRCAQTPPIAATPLVRMDAVSDAFLHGCDVATTPDRFVQLQGADNRAVTISDNRLDPPAGPPVRSGS